MAWSDAARAAALLVRKQHQWSVRGTRERYPNVRAVEVNPGQFDRRELARKLRAMRSGRLPMNASIIGDATDSSVARAYARRTGKAGFYPIPRDENRGYQRPIKALRKAKADSRMRRR